MTVFHATPYDISATGIYFETLADYEAKAATHRNDHGDRVEEYEIRFIDGEDDAYSLGRHPKPASRDHLKTGQ